MNIRPHIRIGTRRSQLALYQAELVRAKILGNFPSFEVELVKITTRGDMTRRANPNPLETKRMYTQEIEDALLRGDVEIAVHSAKDLAVSLPEGLKLGAVLEREDPRDCLMAKDKKKLADFSRGKRIGTSSLRRQRQLLRWNPEVAVEPIRGNVDTRVRKLEEGIFDGIVLAHAGLKRLGLVQYVTEIFEEDRFYPAPGQGAVVVESRLAGGDLDEILGSIHHEESAVRLECERAFLRKLEGGCQLPCGVATRLEEGTLKAFGALFAVEGREWAEARVEGSPDRPAEVGAQLAESVLEAGGRRILEAIRRGAA